VEDKIVLLLAVAILASGCAQDSNPSTSSSGSGVQMESFSVEDTTLSPNQKTRAEAVFVNYNEGDTSLKASNVEIFNLGELKNISRECTPDKIEDAREGINPKMRCTWTLEAPGEEFVEGFESKPASINLRYQYSTTVDSEQPLEVEFKDEVTSRSEKEAEFSDGTVKVSVQTESPISTGRQQEVSLVAENVGTGDVQNGYEFEYTPSTLFQSCEASEIIDGEATADCYLESGSVGERNLFFSTSYKYEEIRNAYIEVVQ